MYFIIEKETQLQKLGKIGDCYINIIPNNDNYHPKLQSVSLIYLRPLEKKKGYIICINHSESLGLDIDNVRDYILLNTEKIFVLNKKNFMYHLFLPSGIIYDINFIQAIDTKDISNNCIIKFYNNYSEMNNINIIIPITKLYEREEEIFQYVVESVIQKYDGNDKIYKFNNNDLTKVFFEIEKQGISVNTEKFNKYFQINNPEYNLHNNKIYTSYNLYTATGRPSNSFNGINFSSLNKTNKERECFISENNVLVQYDINAYHPRLLGKMMNYDLPNKNLYENLGIGKEEMFQNLYGKIVKKHPFFEATSKFLSNLLHSNKYDFETENRKFNWEKEEIDNVNKLLSYLLQSYETSENVKIIQRILEFLKGKKSKLVLYTYDAFLIDHNWGDNEINCSFGEKIKEIINYPVKIKKGYDYENLC
jgi:hypothetical protein